MRGQTRATNSQAVAHESWLVRCSPCVPSAKAIPIISGKGLPLLTENNSQPPFYLDPPPCLLIFRLSVGSTPPSPPPPLFGTGKYVLVLFNLFSFCYSSSFGRFFIISSWYFCYVFFSLFYCFLYHLFVLFHASTWSCFYSCCCSVSCQFSFFIYVYTTLVPLVLLPVSFPFYHYHYV